MSNIPTAKEFIFKNKDRFQGLSVDEWLIEFAKLHVEEALKAAVKDAYIEDFGSMQEGTTCIIDEDSILNAYPLNNIK